MEQQKLPNGTVTLVMGILSLVGCCFYGIPGLIFGVIALILAGKSTSLYKENPELYSDYGNVKIGRVLGIIGIVLSIFYLLCLAWMISIIGWEVLQSGDQELIQEALEEYFNQ
jgi:hypothetical protein